MPDFISREFLGIFLCPVFAVGATEKLQMCSTVTKFTEILGIRTRVLTSAQEVHHPTEPSPPLCFDILKVCVCVCTHMLKYAHTVYAQKHMCGGQRISLRSDCILQTESRMSGPATSTFLPELSYQLEVMGMTVIPAFRKEAEENCGKF